MRTLHVDTGREMRGGQWQALYLIERLQDAILLARQDSPLFVEAGKRGVEVQPLTFFSLRSMMRKVDLVHVHDAGAHTQAVLAKATARPPLVVSRRVAFPVKSGLGSRWKYSKGDSYLAVSKFVAEQLMKAGVPGTKVRVVYDGIPIPVEISRREPGRVVALASKPVEIPGISVEHLDDDLWRALSGASVFVYRSELEGLGSAALAAQASGVPVVASGVGGLPEAVVHGRTGFIVNDGDFLTPVKRLLDDPSLAAEMGNAGRERVQAEFSVDVMVQKTLLAYADLMGSVKINNKK